MRTDGVASTKKPSACGERKTSKRSSQQKYYIVDLPKSCNFAYLLLCFEWREIIFAVRRPDKKIFSVIMGMPLSALDERKAANKRNANSLARRELEGIK